MFTFAPGFGAKLFRQNFLKNCLAPKPAGEDKLAAKGSRGGRVTLYIFYGRSDRLTTL